MTHTPHTFTRYAAVGTPVALGDGVPIRARASVADHTPVWRPAAAATAAAESVATPAAAERLAAPASAATEATTPFAAFAALHRPGSPLLLPNAWDHASAVALVEAGFLAIGTTSLGVAAAVGRPDAVGATREETLRLARRLGRGRERGRFLLSVDAEGGFSDDPADVAELARELAGAGVVGINLEDGRSDGTLAPVELHVAKIEAVKAAVPGLFVNARTDVYWLGGGQEGEDKDEDETSYRLDAYSRAGADGVFVPGLSDRTGIARLVERLHVPLNILHTPSGPTVAELGELGVARVSLGSLLFRVALGAAVGAAVDIRAGRPAGAGAPSYDEVQDRIRITGPLG
uniref:Phosphonomutase-related enzyme n=1 Tax=Streptomyces rimofaciens TaxID=504097 RepID=H9BDX8_9ACTN|nr:phosphonomutase-related enzyme [Streptomyces rimofaciens]